MPYEFPKLWLVRTEGGSRTHLARGQDNVDFPMTHTLCGKNVSSIKPAKHATDLEDVTCRMCRLTIAKDGLTLPTPPLIM